MQVSKPTGGITSTYSQNTILNTNIKIILISLLKFAFSTYLLFFNSFSFVYKAMEVFSAILLLTVYQDSVKTIVQQLHPHPLVNFTDLSDL